MSWVESKGNNFSEYLYEYRMIFGEFSEEDAREYADHVLDNADKVKMEEDERLAFMKAYNEKMGRV